MPKITDDLTIEDGIVMGTVTTDVVGAKCTFAVCSLDEYLEMTDEEANKALVNAMWESGVLDVYF